MSLKAQIRDAQNGQYHWRITAPNNKVIAVGGETFTLHRSAAKSFEKVVRRIHALTPEQLDALIAQAHAK